MEENRGKFIMGQTRRHSMVRIVNFSAEDPDVADVVPERKDQIRLVLQEETGSGKSATGNRNLFESSASSNCEIKRISSESSVRMGKERSVIHTHGFIDNCHETHSRGLG